MDLDELHRLSNGFTKAKVVLAAAELGLYEITSGEGVTAGDAARKIVGDPRATRDSSRSALSRSASAAAC